MPTIIQLRPMSIPDAKQICEWRYEPPYDCYNLPSWKNMVEHDTELANESIRQQQYRSLYMGEELIGFIQLFPLLQVLRLAIFLSPAHCNQGLGQAAVTLAVQAAQNIDATAEIDLEVECWNQRAISCYTKAGFVITDQYELMYRGSSKQVYCMVYEGSNN